MPATACQRRQASLQGISRVETQSARWWRAGQISSSFCCQPGSGRGIPGAWLIKSCRRCNIRRDAREIRVMQMSAQKQQREALDPGEMANENKRYVLSTRRRRASTSTASSLDSGHASAATWAGTCSSRCKLIVGLSCTMFGALSEIRPLERCSEILVERKQI